MSPSKYTRLRDAADDAVSAFGFYTSYTLSEGEHVGETPEPPLLTAGVLRAGGYEPLRLSAAKRHPEDGRLMLADLRRVDRDDVTRQYHVHLWRSEGGGTEVFSHRELRPDIRPVGEESVRDAYERVRTHYRPGDTYEEGEACDHVKRLVGRA